MPQNDETARRNGKVSGSIQVLLLTSPAQIKPLPALIINKRIPQSAEKIIKMHFAEREKLIGFLSLLLGHFDRMAVRATVVSEIL